MSKIAKALVKATQNRSQVLDGRTIEVTGTQEKIDLTEQAITPRRYPTIEAAEENIDGISPIYISTEVCPTLVPGILEEGRLVGGHSRSGLCDAINVLRTKVLQATREKKWNTLLITSPNPGAGKTTAAINLALSLARDLNQTALLVDANLRRPQIAKRIGLGPRSGLADHLAERAPLQDLLVNPGIPKLVVLPAGTTTSDAADLLGSPQMRTLMRDLKNRYPDRYVIIDAPQVIGLPDALTCAEYADAIILVVSAGETTREDLEHTQELLAGRNILGIVLNKVD